LARAMASWTASSKPVSEIALISVTVATLIAFFKSPLFRMLASYYCLYFFAYHLKGEAKPPLSLTTMHPTQLPRTSLRRMSA
jgi:hypothetical protein